MGVCAVRPITDIFVYSRRRQEREFFCEEMSHVLNLDVYPVDTAQQAVEGGSAALKELSDEECQDKRRAGRVHIGVSK